MKKFMKLFIIVSMMILYRNVSYAKIVLPQIISDNMVLQQNTDARLWGMADSQAKVTVWSSWNNKTTKCCSDSDGRWLMSIPTPSAGGPYEIRISSGKDKVILKDVLIGEVWLCSGQSNMGMPISGYEHQPVEGAADLIMKAKPAIPIRICNVQASLEKVPLEFPKTAKWEKNTPEAVSKASATAYFFAKYLNEVLDVPVGIITAYCGGTWIEQWLDPKTLEKYADLLPKGKLSKREQGMLNTIGQHYNGKIAPIEGYTIKGEIWYQGENNIPHPDVYEVLFPAYVQMMRDNWQQGEFPFYYVQIAAHQYRDAQGISAAILREVQLKSLKRIPNSGMAVVIDDKPLTIHPHQKEKVGQRLAYQALCKTYGCQWINPDGPVFKSMEVKGATAYLEFDTDAKRIAPLGYDIPGFEIAGEDKVFYPAKAWIVQRLNRVLVTSPEVKNPVAVRYAYRNFPDSGLYNGYGIPASPFRTDNWE